VNKIDHFISNEYMVYFSWEATMRKIIQKDKSHMTKHILSVSAIALIASIAISWVGIIQIKTKK